MDEISRLAKRAYKMLGIQDRAKYTGSAAADPVRDSIADAVLAEGDRIRAAVRRALFGHSLPPALLDQIDRAMGRARLAG